MFPNALLMSDDLFTGFVNSYQKKKNMATKNSRYKYSSSLGVQNFKKYLRILIAVIDEWKIRTNNKLETIFISPMYRKK